MHRISDKLVSWASILEPSTEHQAHTSASMPFVQPHLALMPDAHLGMGATVGSVIPTERAVIPAAVGVDIGCGMIAARLDCELGDLPDNLEKLREEIARSIPLGAGSRSRFGSGRNAKLTDSAAGRIGMLHEMAEDARFNPEDYHKYWAHQLGSLGGGNHFIEVCLDELDRVWLFLHSGSRGVGNKIAQRHIKVAKELCTRWHVRLPDPDLAYLIEGTTEFNHYIRELMWAQRYALLNREEMMDRVYDQFCRWLFPSDPPDEVERINTHHNFTQREHHMGRNLWITRKGAIQADEGQPGLIPGSMGTRSYVVVGKGFPPSFNSAPHGAGRNFSRSEAKRRFTVEDLAEQTKGVVTLVDEAFIDEIPAAYKDIDIVMADAAELVEVRHELRQLINVKGA